MRGCMLSVIDVATVAAATAASIFLPTITKGQYMEGRIEKIDVKREHRELVALFYRIELATFVYRLMFQHSGNRLG